MRLLDRKEAESGLVNYFAYGSNMNNIILNKRSLKPLKSIPGKAKNWQLTFECTGIPFIEPVYGSIK